MYKTELIRKVAKKTGYSQNAVSFVVNTWIDMIENNLEKGKVVRLTGFGTFYTRKRAKSQALNFRTGEKVQVPQMRVPAFRAGRPLKRAVRGK